jgi:hypothetical protein
MQCRNGKCRREATHGYSTCERCRTSNRNSMRRLRGYNMARDLYLAHVAFGIKVGSSSNVSRRMRQLGVSEYIVFVQKGFFEPLVHQELEAYRVHGVGRETFDCDMSVAVAAVRRVIADRYTESAHGASSGTDSSTEPFDPVEPTSTYGELRDTSVTTGDLASGDTGGDTGGDPGAGTCTAGARSSAAGAGTCPEAQDEGKAAAEEAQSTVDPRGHSGGDPSFAGSRACRTTTPNASPQAACKANAEATRQGRGA